MELNSVGPLLMASPNWRILSDCYFGLRFRSRLSFIGSCSFMMHIRHFQIKQYMYTSIRMKSKKQTHSSTGFTVLVHVHKHKSKTLQLVPVVTTILYWCSLSHHTTQSQYMREDDILWISSLLSVFPNQLSLYIQIYFLGLCYKIWVY